MDDSQEAAREGGMIQTPWEQATGNQRSKRQERSLAKEPGARAQPNSGRTSLGHRDIRKNGFLIEARTTTKASYRIERDEFELITQQAISTPPGSLPGMQIDFEYENGKVMRLFVKRKEDEDYMQQRIALLEDELKAARRA